MDAAFFFFLMLKYAHVIQVGGSVGSIFNSAKCRCGVSFFNSKCCALFMIALMCFRCKALLVCYSMEVSIYPVYPF